MNNPMTLTIAKFPLLFLLISAIGLFGVSQVVSGTLAWQASRPKYIMWSVIVAAGMYIYGIYVVHGKAILRIPHLDAEISRKYQKWAKILFFLTILGALTGVLHRNSLNYLIGDTFKYLLLPFGFLITHSLVRGYKESDLLLKVMAFLSVIPGLGVGSSGFFLGYMVAKWSYKKCFIYTFLVIVALLYTLSLGKTTLISVPILFAIAILILPGLKIKSTIYLLGIPLVLATLVFYLTPSLIHSTEAYKKSVYMFSNLSVDYTQLDDSTYQRIQEVILIKSKFLERASWWNWLVGFGNGATYSARGLPSGLQEMLDSDYSGDAHHIHVNPVFVFHQWGLLGLLVFVWMGSLMWRSFRILRREKLSKFSSKYSFIAIASFLMFLSFIIYGILSPPKNALLYAGMLLGIHVNSMDRIDSLSNYGHS